MRISLRHLVSARLLMLLAAALLLLPGTAFARGVEKPSWNSAGGDGGWNSTEDWN
jgi:hypothetical protein